MSEVDLRDPFLWSSIYGTIRRDMGFDYLKDLEAASLLRELIRSSGSINDPYTSLKEILEGKDVLVVGAGPNCVECVNFASSYDVVIAADGALRCCREVGLEPGVVVTDLDGVTLNDLMSFRGFVVVHAHGDNIGELLRFVPELMKGNSGEGLAGTVQVLPTDSSTCLFGGFTDGDRSAYLANYFRARSVGLVGFDSRGVVGKFSKPYLTHHVMAGRVKLRKLFWASALIQWLRAEGDVNVECLACEGEGWV